MASAWPTSAQTLQFLKDAGVLSASASLPASFSALHTAAAEHLQKEIGYFPWLAATQTRWFDPPNGRFLDLGGGLVSLTSLTIGIQGGSSGTALTHETDFFLLPYNAPTDGRPYEWVEFALDQRGGSKSIKIIGSWGYSATLIPEDVWLAALFTAGLMATGTIAGPGGELTSIKQDDVAYGYSESAGQIAQWKAQRVETIRKYRRRRLG